MPAQYEQFIDWNADGLFTGTGENVTARTLDQRTPLTLRYGRDQIRQFSPTSPGEARFEINNRSRDYSPENPSSPIAGLVLPGRAVLTRSKAIVFANDTFTRTVAGGLGSATTGGAYTLAAGAAADYSVSAGTGRIQLAAVAADHIATLPVAAPDATLSATFTVSAVASGAPIQAFLIGRRFGTNQVALRVSFGTDSVISLAVDVLLSGVTSTPYPLTSTGLAYVAGTSYTAKMELDGTIIRAKVWATAGTEPAGWTAEISSTAVTAQAAAASVIGVRAILPAGNTNTLPITVTVDNLLAQFDARVLFTGTLDDFTVKPAFDEKTISVVCVDGLGQLRGQRISTDLYQGLRTGQAVHAVLDAARWPTTLRDIDAGASTLPWWWADDEDALDALTKLVDSEGPPALLTIDTAGRIVFRDRHHRLQRPLSTTSQSTWRSSGTIEPMISAPAEYQHGWKEIINSVSFQIPIRQPSSSLTPVWTNDGRVGIASGETLLIVARGTGPFYGALTPVPDVDYTVVSGNVTVELTRTSGASTTLRITAFSGPAVVDALQIRGYLLNTVSTVQISGESPSSITTYGRRDMPDSKTPVWASPGDVRAIIAIMLGQRSDRLPTISVTMSGGITSRLVQMMTRNLSDRVRVVEPHSGLDADCHIEQIAHTITGGGTDHKTVFGLEKAATQITGVFVLGSATQGVLGTNKLGRRGLTDPTTMFVLGSATQGVLGTNLLAA